MNNEDRREKLLRALNPGADRAWVAFHPNPPGHLSYSDGDRTLRFKDASGCDVAVTAPEGMVLRFYVDGNASFYLPVPKPERAIDGQS